MLLVCVLTVSAAAEPPPTFERSWGTSGSNPGQFNQPHGIAIGDSGYIYATDGVASRIQVFKPDGTLVFYWGGRGTGPGTFNGTWSVAVAPDKSVYVLDANSSRIHKFTPRGDFILWWTVSALVSGLAAGSGGNVFVPDTPNQRVLEFSPSGQLINSWGHHGNEPGGFSGSLAVATDGRGNVYVGDDHRIHKFTEDGVFVFAWDAPNSWALAAMPNGQVYAACGLVGVARKYSATGTLLSQWGGLGGGPGQFRRAAGIAVDSLGAIYVVDEDADRISKFVPSVPVAPVTWGGVKTLFQGLRR